MSCSVSVASAPVISLPTKHKTALIAMRTFPVIPLLLVAILSFGAGAFWFGGQSDSGPDLAVSSTPVNSVADSRMERAPSQNPGIQMHSRELVGAYLSEPKGSTARADLLGTPAQGIAGVFGELDALRKRGGFSEHELQGFLGDLITGLLKEGDHAHALRILDLYGRGVIKDVSIYERVADSMYRKGLIQDSLDLHLRLLASFEDIGRSFWAVRRISPQAALDALRQNLPRLSKSQQQEFRMDELELLIELGRTAEAREFLDGVLKNSPPDLQTLSIMHELAPLEAMALIDSLYEQDGGKWAADYVDLLEMNGDIGRALEVLREAMVGDQDDEVLLGQLLLLSPLEGYTYLVNQGAPVEGDANACDLWSSSARELKDLGYLDQAIDLWQAAFIASPGVDLVLYRELIVQAPAVLAEALAAKIGESWDVDNLERLAMAYWHAGQIEDALRVLKKCIQISGDEQGYKQEIEDILSGKEPEN
jgi:tetratricopeptide (TPR) repeat protein